MTDLTIIVPTFNEEDGLPATLRELLPTADRLGWRVLVVDDGSTDGTAATLAAVPGVRVIRHPLNRGYGAALKTGIVNAKTRWVAFYDADGQHNPADLEKLAAAIGTADMVVGQRGRDSHKDWLRKPGKWVLARTAEFLTERRIPDLNSGLRIVRRDIILALLHLLPDGFSFSTTSTVALMNLGFTVQYHPIRVNKRLGKSTVRQLKHGSQTILLIIRLILLFNPLKVFTPVSLFLFFGGAVYEVVYGIVLRQGHPRLIPGAFFSLVMAMLIFLIGLLADQISSLRKNLHFEKLLAAWVERDNGRGPEAEP